MNRPTFADHTGCSRTFVSCLMISLIILSPLAPLASATQRFFKRGEALHIIDPAALLVPNITASKTDTFSDPNADGKAEPGDTITYDVNVTNSGTDATNVNFADTIDANTTLVPGSLKVSPLAFDDTYVAAKDSPLSVGAPGVLTNDTGIPAPTAVTIAGGATTQGGTVTLNADGSFLYNPPAGFEGSDTFTYTATNGLAPNDTTTVTITVDAAPTVASTTPTNGATNQALNTNITVTFSEPVNVTGNWFQISCPTSGTRNVADTVVTGGSTTFTINPNTDFSPNETCTVTVSAAQVSDQDSADPPDNMTANFVFSFTTIDVAPTVTSTTPTNGAVNQTTNTDISVTFSEPVNVGPTWFQIVCGTSGTRNVVDTVVTGGPTTFTINPNADFAAGETCTVTISATQVTDQDTNDPPDNMAANFVFSFTMDAAPTVNATTPTNGATQVANNTNVTITFSEPVDVTGNWFQIVGATSGTRNVADTAVTGGPTTFTINPNVDFTNGEVVTVTVFAAQVSDQDSADPPQNMAANFVFSFTIDLPPSVTSTVPTNGAIDVLKGSNIVVNFSENVNATTSSFTISCPAPGNLQAFAVSGSGTNAITLNPTADLPPGVICTVTVIANQISDTDAGDPPDNMVADFVFSFGVKPEATDDARNATGNIQIQTAGRSNFTVLSNDIGPGIMVTAFDATSLRGGNVAVAASGTLTYNPPAGYEGLDSFNYTISNPAGSDVGTVVITVTGMIWFVNSSASSCATINGACGRLTNPFSTLAAFETANGNASPVVNGDVTSPEAGDHLFVYTGAGSYNSSLTLENTQRVIGQGSTSSLQTLSGVTPATDSDALPATGGTSPIITNSGGGGIAVAQNNRIHGLTIQNTTGTGLSGSAFGTLTVSENVIVSNTTTAGTAVNLTNGTLAATFRSISAGNNDGNPDPANGIVLTTTSGTFTVDGDGANTAVGGNASGGTIQNTVGADGATGGNGVFLSGAAGVTLRRMTISGTNQNNGIRLINSSNFTLEFSRVTGSNGNSGAQDESSLHFDNLTGTAAITSCVIEGGFEDNLNVVNTSGTLNRLTISGTTFGFNSAAGGNNSITFDAQNAGTTLNFTLKSSLIKGSHIDWLNAAANSGSNMDAVIGGPLVADGNSFDNTGANAFVGPIPNGNRLVTGSIGNMTLDIRNNTLKGSLGEAIRVRSSATGALTGTMNARVRNNTIGVAATANSGSTAGSGIFVLGDGGSDMNVAVTNNSVFQYNQSGIMLQFGDETNDGAVYNATVTGNTVNTPGTLLTNFNAIQLNNGTIMATDNFTTCADIGGAGVGNNVAGGGKGAVAPNNVDIRLRQRQTTTVRLPGYVGPVRDNTDSDVAEVAAYLAGRNTLTTAAGNSVPTGGGFIGGAACTAPSFAGPITLSFNKRNATFEKLPMEVPVSDNQPENILWATKRQNENEKMTMEVPASNEQPENILWATKGQNDNEQHVVKLTQSEVSAMVQAAIARWAEAGISAKNLDKLQALTFEIVDLPAGQLASASSSKITLDETAAGYGWFFDPTPSDDNEFEVSVPNQELQTTELSAAHGRVDLLTVLMRQLGSGLSGAKLALKAPQAWLMEGTLGTGTRRAPAFTVRKMGKTLLVPGATVKQVRATTAMKSAKTPMPADARVKRTASPASESQSLTLHAGIDARTQPQAIRSRASANDKPKLVNRRRSASQTFSHHATSKPRAALTAKPVRIAPASILSGETVSHSIGTLKSGKTVHIQFQVTVDTPFLGSSSEVANQGTVTFDGGGPVLTDDPSVGGANDPTVTPIAVPPNLFVRDASVAEPASGSTSMIFTLALSAPAPIGGITANVSTADGTATGGTCAGGNDFESVSGGLVTFNAGDQIKTFPVTVCSDAAAEGDETFTLNVNSAPGAVITDGTGTGTITANVPGTIIISELRTSGPGGDGDDFVEIYNNTDAPHTVPAGGYGLFKRGASCDALPVLIGTIPAGTIIPQRGHYLFTGSAYSLANYGGTGAAAGDQALAADLESDFNVGLFSTVDPLAISTANRLDAVGFGVSTGGVCDVLLEGTTLPPASGSTSQYSFVREFTLVSNNVPTPTDANDNATDFTVVSTTGTPVGANASTLGAPGPENLTSPPLKKFTQVGAFFLDQTKAPSAEPNRHRDLTVVPNGALGTLSSRRRFVNNTGGAITRLRFRIYDITTFPVPTGTADLRALTSVSVSVGGVADPTTCAAAGSTPPCTVTVLGTTLEEPPTQTNGGGLNSSMTAGTVTMATPIANGASINLQFLFGIQQSGSFRVFVFVEALP